jgi:hypothetical protein
MDIIKIKLGKKLMKLSLAEASKTTEDKKIMEECILAVINPKAVQYSDIYIEPAEALVWLQNYFLREGYWKPEFINEIFESK